MTHGRHRSSPLLWGIGVFVLSPLVLTAGVVALVTAVAVAATGRITAVARNRREAVAAPPGATGIVVALRPDRRAEAPARAAVELRLGRAA